MNAGLSATSPSTGKLLGRALMERFFRSCENRDSHVPSETGRASRSVSINSEAIKENGYREVQRSGLSLREEKRW